MRIISFHFSSLFFGLQSKLVLLGHDRRVFSIWRSFGARRQIGRDLRLRDLGLDAQWGLLQVGHWHWSRLLVAGVDFRCWWLVLLVGWGLYHLGKKKQFVRDANFVCNLVSRLISGWTVPRPLSIANGKSINSTTRIICKPDSSLFPRRGRLWYIYRYLLVLVILWVILTMWGCSRSGK